MFSRVWVPRQYTGLSKNLLPMYDTSSGNGIQPNVWERVQDLTEIEKRHLLDLESEIKEKQMFFLGTGGITATAMGDINLIKKMFER